MTSALANQRQSWWKLVIILTFCTSSQKEVRMGKHHNSLAKQGGPTWQSKEDVKFVKKCEKMECEIWMESPALRSTHIAARSGERSHFFS
jgi:hypothetical protein